MAASTAREAGVIGNRFIREAGTSLGTGIARLGSPLQDYVDKAQAHVDSQAISQGSTAYSGLFGDLTQQWNKLASQSDPNNTSIRQGFSEKVLDPSLQKFRDSFNDSSPQVQQWADQRVNTLRQHFTEKTIADMATRAADASHQNIATSERNYSQTLMYDPSALDHVTEAFSADVKTMLESNPNLDAQQAAHIHDVLVPAALQRMAKAAAYGIGSKDPQALISAIDAGKFDQFFDAGEKQTAIKLAEQVQHEQLARQEHEQAVADRQKKQLQQDTADQYVQSILTGKSIKGYETDPKLSGAERENITNFQHQHMMQLRERTDTTPHPEQYRSLLNTLFDKAQSDPNNLSVQPIREAFQKGLLNPREEAELENRFNALDKPMERAFHNQTLLVERQLSGNLMLKSQAMMDPTAIPRIVTAMENDAYAKINAARAAGHDITPLITPTSPQYVYSKDIVQSYLQSPKQVISDQASKVRAGAEVQGTIGGGPVSSVSPQEANARAAIARGADAAKVRERYKQLTGVELR